MLTHKKQHYIPQCYLKSWCDPDAPSTYEPYVWMFNVDGTFPKNKAPVNIFHETDMYTIKGIDGSRDLRLEHGLSQLEDNFAKLRDTKIQKQQSLELEEHLYLCAFSAAMQVRTKASCEHHKSQWSPLLEKMDEMTELAKTAQANQLSQYYAAYAPSTSTRKSIRYEDVRCMSEKPLQILIPAALENITPILHKMNLAVLLTDNEVGFITSDHPCVWLDPQSNKMPAMFRSPSLGSETIEVTLPIAYNCCALFSWQDFSGYIPVSDIIVDEINRRTRLHADEYFVVRREITKPRWFEHEEAPTL